MSTIDNTRTSTGNSRTLVVSWLNLANGDDGAPLDFSQYADKTAQVVGTFGANGNLRLEGSNDGTNWAVLTDPQGNALDIATAKLELVSEAPRYLRPRVTAGDGTTSLSVFIHLKE